MNLHGGPPPGGQQSNQNPELSFEDFTAMSPFLDPAALHLNPYAAAAASSTGRHTRFAVLNMSLKNSCLFLRHFYTYWLFITYHLYIKLECKLAKSKECSIDGACTSFK